MSLKDFVILAKLGEGAYSCVYKVQRIVDSQVYALKKVKMSNLQEKEQENALNEVRILASIKHPNIIGYRHAFIEANSLCIVMEYSDDGDLYQKIVEHEKQATNFSEDSVWRTLLQVTSGLHKLHSMHILHRDLKSANVFLNKNGVAKLGDMNVSKLAKDGLLYTQTGTPYYASPQVWKDQPYNSKSDIWSLGCVVYQMTTLKPPFRAEDMNGLFKRVIKGSYPKIGDAYSKQLASVIKSLLQVNPDNRPDASQLLHSLKSKADELGTELGTFVPNQQLLQTIRVNKNLHYLTERMPMSNYENGHEVVRSHKSSKQTKIVANGQQSMNISNVRSINLPRLDRIVLRQNNHKLSVSEPRKHEGALEGKSLENLLKIEGKGSHHVHDYAYKQHKRSVDRDIKAELKKIYDLKSLPNKVRPRQSELPRIN